MIDSLPSAVAIEGKSYDINTDFKTWIRFSALLENSGKLKAEALFLKIALLCFKPPREGKVSLPSSWRKTLEALCDFYTMGKRAKGGRGGGAPLFSFTDDAELIYAAFMQAYGIDLAAENMHWHRFCALFCSLPESTVFCRVAAIRARDLSSVADKKARARLAGLKRAFALTDRRSEDEIQNDIADALW